MTQEAGLTAYSGTMDLELPDGSTVECRVPTLKEAMALWRVRARIYKGDEDAVLELMEQLPAALGLTERLAATPIIPSEMLQLANRFFVQPVRRPYPEIRVVPENSTLTTSSPSSPPTSPAS